MPNVRVESSVKWRTSSGSASSGSRGGSLRASSAGTSAAGTPGSAIRDARRPGRDFS
jgi:hypothetical protein